MGHFRWSYGWRLARSPGHCQREENWAVGFAFSRVVRCNVFLNESMEASSFRLHHHSDRRGPLFGAGDLAWI